MPPWAHQKVFFILRGNHDSPRSSSVAPSPTSFSLVSPHACTLSHGVLAFSSRDAFSPGPSLPLPQLRQQVAAGVESKAWGTSASECLVSLGNAAECLLSMNVPGWRQRDLAWALRWQRRVDLGSGKAELSSARRQMAWWAASATISFVVVVRRATRKAFLWFAASFDSPALGLGLNWHNGCGECGIAGHMRLAVRFGQWQETLSPGLCWRDDGGRAGSLATRSPRRARIRPAQGGARPRAPMSRQMWWRWACDGLRVRAGDNEATVALRPLLRCAMFELGEWEENVVAMETG